MSGHWEILISESHCTYNNINMLYAVFFFTSFLLYFVTYFYFQTVQHKFPFCYIHVYIAVKKFISLKVFFAEHKTILNKVLGLALCLKLFKLKKKYLNAAIQEIVYKIEYSSYSSKLVKVTIMTILFEIKRMLSTSLIRRKQRIADRLTTGCKKICDLQRFFIP